MKTRAKFIAAVAVVAIAAAAAWPGLSALDGAAGNCGAVLVSYRMQ